MPCIENFLSVVYFAIIELLYSTSVQMFEFVMQTKHTVLHKLNHYLSSCYMENMALKERSENKYSTWLCLILYLSLAHSLCYIFIALASMF